MRRSAKQPRVRGGAAAVELAVLLPFLVFLFVVAVDFARVFYFSQVIENCARNGALYASNVSATQSPYASVEAAALADAGALTPQPTVVTTTGQDQAGNPFVRVTVTWRFRTITGFPGVPDVDLSRAVQMRVVSQ